VAAPAISAAQRLNDLGVFWRAPAHVAEAARARGGWQTSMARLSGKTLGVIGPELGSRCQDRLGVRHAGLAWSQKSPARGCRRRAALVSKEMLRDRHRLLHAWYELRRAIIGGGNCADEAHWRLVTPRAGLCGRIGAHRALKAGQIARRDRCLRCGTTAAHIPVGTSTTCSQAPHRMCRADLYDASTAYGSKIPCVADARH